MAEINYKEYARQMRENCAKDHYGNIICSDELWEQIASIIEKIPTADVVEVVRCKDCKNWEKFDGKHRSDGCCGELIYRHGAEMWATESEHFCGYGVRKESDT